MLYNDSIVALDTFWLELLQSSISGAEAITIGNSVFKSIKNKDFKQKTHTLHLGHIIDDQKTLDEVLVSLF
jgi:tRNA modification GTPase